MKIHPVGDELFHVDGQTDMNKTIVTFRNFDTDGTLQLIPATYLEYWSLKLTEDHCYQ